MTVYNHPTKIKNRFPAKLGKKGKGATDIFFEFDSKYWNSVYRSHLETYTIVCSKPPDYIADVIRVHSSTDEFKKFNRKLGIIINEDGIHLYEGFGNEAFFIEFAALLSFIPEKFRDVQVIRKLLFIVIYPKYEYSIAKSSWLNSKFHVVIRKLEQNLDSQSSTSFYTDDTLYAFVKTADISRILQDLIPYLDSGISKGEIIQNIHYLFSPRYEFSYKMMNEVYINERILNEFFNNPKKKGALPCLIPMQSTFNFTYEYLGLSQFDVNFQLFPNIASDFQFSKKIIEIIGEIPFFNQINFNSNRQFSFLCFFPRESISMINVYLNQLYQSKIIEKFHIFEIRKVFFELLTSKSNLNWIRSQSISLEKTERSDIHKFDTFLYDRPAKDLITPLDFFLALKGRIFIPVLGTIQTKQEISRSIQKAIKGYLRFHKDDIRLYLPTLYPLSTQVLSQKNIMGYYQDVGNSKILQCSPLNMFHLSKIYDSSGFAVTISEKSAIIHQFFAFKNALDCFDSNSNLYRYIVQLSWKEILIGLVALSYEPFLAYFHPWISTKKNLDVSISQYFNFNTQKWDVSQYSFSDSIQKIVALSKTSEIKKNKRILDDENFGDSKKYKILAPLPTIRKIIKKYRNIYHQLKAPGIRSDFIIDYIKDSILAHRFLHSSAVNGYTKQLQYIEKNAQYLTPFFHPMLSNFTRVHVILTSRGLWLHPKSLSSHEILRGLFTIGLMQTYYAGGTQDGVLLLEYLIPISFFIDPSSEFHRLVKRIKNTAKNYSIRVLEIDKYSLSMNKWNLKVEGFKTKQFMKFGNSRGKKGQIVQNQNPVYNFYYNRMPSAELESSYKSIDPSTIPQELLPGLYSSDVLFDPVINWQLLLFLQHSIYFFIWIKNVKQDENDKNPKIENFFQQFSFVEIFTSTKNEKNQQDFQILIHLKNNIYFLVHRIYDQLKEWNFAVQTNYIFPYEIIRDSPITRIMEISRQNPFQKDRNQKYKNPSQFPIFRYYKQDNCYSPEETVQIYEKYYAPSDEPRKPIENINEIKKEFKGI